MAQKMQVFLLLKLLDPLILVADKVKAYKKDLEDKVIESSKDLKKNS